uniref:Uncharacterized protein n=1 Tax=Ciona intestinalis TaxID=7719 RepID=H2XZS8_CIOIN
MYSMRVRQSCAVEYFGRFDYLEVQNEVMQIYAVYLNLFFIHIYCVQSAGHQSWQDKQTSFLRRIMKATAARVPTRVVDLIVHIWKI